MIVGVDDQRVGRALRALRRRRDMRQSDVAAVAGVSRSLVSLAERGHIASISIRTVRAMFATVDAGFDGQVHWRGGGIDRLLDQAHAEIVVAAVSALSRFDWRCFVEVTYSEWGERGSIDVLAVHERTRTVLVVEVKSELQSLEGTVRKLDEKARLAKGLVAERVSWRPETVSRVLVLPATEAARRRVTTGAAASILGVAFPGRGAALRRWLREPQEPVAGILFVSIANPSGVNRGRGGPDRVRRPHPVASERDVDAVRIETVLGRRQRAG
jgi:transcriptional regulator with XRE-family HTH domain